jgi:hypothetical protein
MCSSIVLRTCFYIMNSQYFRKIGILKVYIKKIIDEALRKNQNLSTFFQTYFQEDVDLRSTFFTSFYPIQKSSKFFYLQNPSGS